MTTKHFLLSGWDWNPGVAALCVLALAGYFAIFGSLRRPRAWLFLLGLILFAATMISPLGTLARGYLFSAHMTQHLLLLLIVPALLVLGLPRQDANHLWQEVRIGEGMLAAKQVALSWVAGVGTMWFWHVPALCNAAVGNLWVQRLQTVSLLAMGMLFWWPVIGPRKSRLLGPLAGVAYLSTACMACTLLGIFITFSPVEICSVYHHPVDRLGILPLIRQGWGLTPAVDQQVGGLLMWVPACLIY
ncbi:MAG TPA: cytochrome c oxidase assembly protein, partial [Candidatus Angelobacter sp.]|nr:cytochrome c oxidase assembly protein [Candidatus Angelobacter sp.]